MRTDFDSTSDGSTLFSKIINGIKANQKAQGH